VAPGADQLYTVEVMNNGPSTATSLVIVNTLPSQTTFVSAQLPGGSCSHSTGVVTCNLASLGVGASKTVTITATVDPAFVGLLYDSASVNAIEPDPIPFDNSAVVDTLVREGIFSDGFESGDTSTW
jgi:uncharacterized repeat protein (TIGR01451 family)